MSSPRIEKEYIVYNLFIRSRSFQIFVSSLNQSSWRTWHLCSLLYNAISPNNSDPICRGKVGRGQWTSTGDLSLNSWKYYLTTYQILSRISYLQNNVWKKPKKAANRLLNCKPGNRQTAACMTWKSQWSCSSWDPWQPASLWSLNNSGVYGEKPERPPGVVQRALFVDSCRELTFLWTPNVGMQFSMNIFTFLYYLGLLNKEHWQTWLKTDLMANLLRKLG